ncbi:DUF4176 domain-containing protein [uncultured Lactobacillus sp.]|uniref:DUF4176 domain-containing protein n=1 Tax=uncultured Lactobacillus sp. TaxID=153152 RepID=UPI0026208C99|nr:DUF4176 domain-containing protein [uncultured Lactobacillus sp.]
MERVDFLPLGSVVVLKGMVKKLVIVQRAVTVGDDEDPEAAPKYYDYGGALHPEGLVDGKLAYFNRDDIYRIVFEGYSDKDDELMIDEINEVISKLDDAQQGHSDLSIVQDEEADEKEDKRPNDSLFDGLSEKFDDED